MQLIMNLLNSLGLHLYPYLSEISTALVACLLVISGGKINRALCAMLRNESFIVRTLVFVLINAFGYGLIIVKATPYISQTLRSLDAGIMLITVIVSFFAIGAWAQRNRQV